jgi:hypothetical protein
MKCENNRKEFVEIFLCRVLGNLCTEREVNENVDKNKQRDSSDLSILNVHYMNGKCWVQGGR